VLIGTIVNALAVICGGSIGLLLKKGFPEKLNKTIMKGLGLCVLYIGITGMLEGINTLIIIISIVIGASIGELLDLDKRLSDMAKKIEEKVGSKKNIEKKEQSTIAEGLVTSTLLFCVGAMAIVGSLQSGLGQGHDTIYTKAILDFVAAILFASTLGIGVLFSAILVFLYQGSITLLANFIAPFLSDVVVSEMTCVGSLLIAGLAFNMLEMTKIKVMNYVPAIFMPILIYGGIGLYTRYF
jgi:Uncharacterized membrane protein, possible Na+ channel or pump